MHQSFLEQTPPTAKRNIKITLQMFFAQHVAIYMGISTNTHPPPTTSPHYTHQFCKYILILFYRLSEHKQQRKLWTCQSEFRSGTEKWGHHYPNPATLRGHHRIFVLRRTNQWESLHYHNFSSRGTVAQKHFLAENWNSQCKSTNPTRNNHDWDFSSRAKLLFIFFLL